MLNRQKDNEIRIYMPFHASVRHEGAGANFSEFKPEDNALGQDEYKLNTQNGEGKSLVYHFINSDRMSYDKLAKRMDKPNTLVAQDAITVTIDAEDKHITTTSTNSRAPTLDIDA